MKNILKSALLLACGAVMFSSCEDDRDSNPTLQQPGEFVLYTPACAGNLLDLNNSTITVMGKAVNFGFPVEVTYEVECSANSDMSDALLLSSTSNLPRIESVGNEIAVGITNYLVDHGKTEAEFPVQIPVYLRGKASCGGIVVYSNVVCLEKCYIPFSLPAVNVPEKLYITGNFCGWSWDTGTCVEMNPVWGAPEVFWSMVWVDESGIKFNSAQAWDGGEQGYNNVRTVEGDKAADIADAGGNFGSATPAWYLMIVTGEVVGREVKYDVQFNAPNVWLMGSITPGAAWSELEDGCLFDVPTEKDADFVSPAFAHDVVGDGGARCYVKVPGYDWWKTEFVPLNGTIVYRGAGDDQERVDGKEGQRFYLNFFTGKGSIK